MDASENDGAPAPSVMGGIDALEMLVLVGIVALCSVSMGSLASAPQPLAHAALSIVAFGCYGVATCAIARARVAAHASRRAAHARVVADAHAQTIDAFGSLIRRVERRAHDERGPGGLPPTDEARCATCAEMARVLAQERCAALDAERAVVPEMRNAPAVYSAADEDSIVRETLRRWPEARGHLLQPVDSEHQRRSHSVSRAASAQASPRAERPAASPPRSPVVGVGVGLGMASLKEE